jgi:putative nucleotidyltransferase with HDIG domain
MASALISPRRLEAVPDQPAGVPGRQGHQHRGHGQRLLVAIAAVEQFPALATASKRALRLIEESSGPSTSHVRVIESDVALAGRVLRAANRGRRPKHALGSIHEAADALGPAWIAEIAREVPTSDFFQPVTGFGVSADSFRLHAVAVQQMTGRLALQLERSDYEELVMAGLLHDIGKLVLRHAYPDYPDDVLSRAKTPEQKVQSERETLGFDHAAIGGVVARRWGLPHSLAAAIHNHHADDAAGAAAVLRLADMLVHYAHGNHVAAKPMLAIAAGLDIGPSDLRSLMYELPSSGGVPARARPSPLTRAEAKVLRLLAQGKVYKQIALDLGLSTSTVRTHLYNTYRKLEVHDRAQAVLLATECGWIEAGVPA